MLSREKINTNVLETLKQNVNIQEDVCACIVIISTVVFVVIDAGK
jgi:hypothetical protein